MKKARPSSRTDEGKEGWVMEVWKGEVGVEERGNGRVEVKRAVRV